MSTRAEQMAHLHHGEPHTHRDCPMLIAVVAEVERLRARNEALEKVAKAANASPCRHSSEVRGDNCSLCVALSALAEPGNGGATSERQRGVAGDRCEAGNNCGRPGCPECQA